MLKVVSLREIQPDKLAEALMLYAELAKASRMEPGCIDYEVCQSVQKRETLMIVESWQDEAALDFHRATEPFTRIVPQIVERSVSGELLIGQVVNR